MSLDWQPVPSSSKTVSHPGLVASEVRGGSTVAFVPFAEADGDPWTRGDRDYVTQP